MKKVRLSSKHLKAVDRRRRIINHYDTQLPRCGAAPVKDMVKAVMEFADWQGHQIDSVWLDVGGDGGACHPSKFLQPVNTDIKKYLEAGNDPVGAIIEECKKRGFEVFAAHRMNQPPDHSFGMDVPPIQEAHPDWLINFNPDPEGVPNYTLPWYERGGHSGCMWNYAVPQVHQHRKNVVCELAENYNIDGILLDWSRGCPHLPIGRQWELRDCLTACIRLLRQSLQKVAQRRSQPLIVAARVPETLQGCHFDGMDVETWVEERLVDIFILGDRSLEVDIAAFRNLTAGTHIKLYPSHDHHHASDGYKMAPIEILRGVAQNWWRQGADGIHVINFLCSTPEKMKKVGLLEGINASKFGFAGHDWQQNREMFRQIGSIETLHHQNKTFVVQRRAGGMRPILGFPEEGYTQRLTYHLSNMESKLPARFGQHGRGLTLLHLYVGDDVNSETEHVESVVLRMLLFDPNSRELPPNECIEPGIARRSTYGEPDYKTTPITREMARRVEVRLNNISLGPATVKEGWLVFSVNPEQMAAGVNLVGIRVTDEPVGKICADLTKCTWSKPPPKLPDEAVDSIRIERLEMEVKYL